MQNLAMNNICKEVEEEKETKHNVISGYNLDHIMIDEPMKSQTRSYYHVGDLREYDDDNDEDIDSIIDDTSHTSSHQNDKGLDTLTNVSRNGSSTSPGSSASFITLRDMTDCTIEV